MSTGTEIFPDLNVPKMSIKNQLDEMSNPFLQEMSETFDSESSTFKFQETKESIVKWDIYEKDDFKMGILRLESFTPSESTIPETVLLIRELLLNELKDTDALVIDLRF